MPINNITQTISELPAAGRRGVDVQTQFVIKQEDFQDHLQGITVTELNTLKDQLNTRIGEINSTATTMNGYVTSASSSATTATTKAGEASTSASAALTSKNQASTFATNASNSATKASQWADNNYNVEVETGKYSAKHWSTVAENATSGKIDKVTSTDNAVVRFDGTTGKVQNSGVVIDDSGNVGIGVAPSVWGSTWKSLDLLSSSISSYTTLTDPYTIISNNAYISGSSSTLNSVYKNNGSANSYSQGEGAHFWKIAPSGTAGNSITWTNAMILNASGNLLVTGGGGIGYGAGSGGTVTQLTSKSTAVALNKPTGMITMNSAALIPNLKVSFILYNSRIASTDSIILSVVSGSTVLAQYEARGRCSDGVAEIVVSHTYSSSLSEAIVLNFTIIKGANS